MASYKADYPEDYDLCVYDLRQILRRKFNPLFETEIYTYTNPFNYSIEFLNYKLYISRDVSYLIWFNKEQNLSFIIKNIDKFDTSPYNGPFKNYSPIEINDFLDILEENNCFRHKNV